jgi:hypothetical protein
MTYLSLLVIYGNMLLILTKRVNFGFDVIPTNIRNNSAIITVYDSHNNHRILAVSKHICHTDALDHKAMEHIIIHAIRRMLNNISPAYSQGILISFVH